VTLSSLFEASRVPLESADSRGGCVDCKPCFWLVAAIVIHVFICWQHCQQMNNLVYSVVRLAALHAHSHVLTHTACRAAVPDLTSTEVKPFHNAGNEHLTTHVQIPTLCTRLHHERVASFQQCSTSRKTVTSHKAQCTFAQGTKWQIS